MTKTHKLPFAVARIQRELLHAAGRCDGGLYIRDKRDSLRRLLTYMHDHMSPGSWLIRSTVMQVIQVPFIDQSPRSAACQVRSCSKDIETIIDETPQHVRVVVRKTIIINTDMC